MDLDQPGVDNIFGGFYLECFEISIFHLFQKIPNKGRVKKKVGIFPLGFSENINQKVKDMNQK